MRYTDTNSESILFADENFGRKLKVAISHQTKDLLFPPKEKCTTFKQQIVNSPYQILKKP